MKHLDRITFNPKRCGGRPCVRGIRIRVKEVLDWLAGGVPAKEIVGHAPSKPALLDRSQLQYGPLVLRSPHLLFRADQPVDTQDPAFPSRQLDLHCVSHHLAKGAQPFYLAEANRPNNDSNSATGSFPFLAAAHGRPQLLSERQGSGVSPDALDRRETQVEFHQAHIDARRRRLGPRAARGVKPSRILGFRHSGNLPPCAPKPSLERHFWLNTQPPAQPPMKSARVSRCC